jgi:hypothetical protein
LTGYVDGKGCDLFVDDVFFFAEKFEDVDYLLFGEGFNLNLIEFILPKKSSESS